MITLTDSNSTDSLDNSKVVIQGGTDNTTIGNVGDSLKVSGTITSGANIPSGYCVEVSEYVLNGSSSAMNVNGSVTPVNFDFTPPSGQTYYITAIGIYIADGTTPNETEFGDIAALTNGLRLNVTTNGTEYTFCNSKNNLDLAFQYSGDYSQNYGQNTGFFDKADMALMFKTFLQPLILKNSTSDRIRFTVRDNLTTVDTLRAFVKGFKVL